MTLGTCPPKGVFIITFLTHVPNFRKIGQKLWSLSWTKRFADTQIHTHTHTDKHSSDFISVQCHELHWTDNDPTNSVSVDLVTRVQCLLRKNDSDISSCTPPLFLQEVKSAKFRFDFLPPSRFKRSRFETRQPVGNLTRAS